MLMGSLGTLSFTVSTALSKALLAIREKLSCFFFILNGVEVNTFVPYCTDSLKARSSGDYKEFTILHRVLVTY